MVGGISMNEKVNISINGNEKSKNEIIYNNVMEELNQEEQVKYLKSKVTRLELEMKNKMVALILILSSIIGFSIGIYFLILNLFVLGTIIIFSTFIVVMIRFYMMYKSILNIIRDKEFDKVDQLYKLLNSRLK